MAEWQYRIQRINFEPEGDADVHLEKILREYGQQGMGVGARCLPDMR